MLKFGDRVKVGKLDKSQSHFPQEIEAIVLYSDVSIHFKHGGDVKIDDEPKSYGLFIKGLGSTSWYDVKDLTLIDYDRLDLYKEWLFEYKCKGYNDLQDHKYRLA